MYSQFFGLQGPPFRITPDTSFFYSGGEREALINAIAYAISHGDGIIKVVGEVGSGKTMLSRMLASQLPDNITLVFLLNPSLQARDLVYAIGRELGLELDRTCTKSDALQRVQNKLLAMHANNQRAVVFIDEAQCMPLETLEELRLLSNLETETDKLLQLVLFGQPELDEHLSDASVRQIKERIIHSFYLKPFTLAEVGEYLSFRLHKAGYNGSPFFTAAALKLLTRFSSGLPRKLTILADKSLLAAFAAQSRSVDASHVRLAAKDSGQLNSGSKYIRVLLVLVSAFLVWGLTVYKPSVGNVGLGDAVRTETHLGAVEESDSTLNKEQPAALEIGHSLPAEKPITASVPEISSVSVLKKGPVTTEPITIEALTLKTQQWMVASSGAVYTIQILSAEAEDDQFLEHFFMNVKRDIGLNELYVHPMRDGGKPIFAVTLGGFADFGKAREYLASLPVFIQRYQPYIKNISSFKSRDQ
ncbi:hypothetical protein A9Q88_07545 [Gammaproteobacteria bacterium 50_400_T64]|nr:hypothetical protein A9Q88_07545 [Gammaproteobacteria bacterium 50_400_T64]